MCNLFKTCSELVRIELRFHSCRQTDLRLTLSSPNQHSLITLFAKLSLAKNNGRSNSPFAQSNVRLNGRR